MDEDKLKKASEALQQAKDQFQLLKDTLQYLSIQKQFGLAQTIIGHVTNDEALLEVCAENQDYANRRKVLLDSIQSFQKELIEMILQLTIQRDIDFTLNVRNFNEARSALKELAQAELENGFLSEGISPILSNIPECIQHIVTLNDVIARINGEIYNVLIMGEYQSGKTTLINAIVGQYVGAIGDGTATSAVPISYTYGEKENVSIIWKSKEQLVELLAPLDRYITDMDFNSFDLDDKAQRDEWLKQLNIFRKDKGCPSVAESGCKLLAVCGLILKYYGSAELAEMMSHEFVFDDLATITKFPHRGDDANFQTIWKRRGETSFTVLSSLFAFIERVECQVNSVRLKELNCTITDAPGLFSNDYDTRITINEMQIADAILYLLPYDKEAGQNSCGSLYTIHNQYPDVSRKLFLVNNRSLCDKKKNFVSANRETILEMFGEEMALHVVDAQLGWLGIIKETYLSGKLPKAQIREFVEQTLELDTTDVNLDQAFTDAWNEAIYPYRLKGEFTPAHLIELSELDIVLKNLINFIQVNKAYSIVISNGIGKLYNELTRVRKSLNLQRIEPFIKGHDALVNLWDSRLERADVFSEKVKDESKAHLFESQYGGLPLCERLANGVSSKLFSDDIIRKLGSDIAKTIYANKWKLVKIGKNEQKLRNFLTPKLSEVVVDLVKSRISYWNDMIKTNQDTTFINIFTPEMALLRLKLEKEWHSIYADDKEFYDAMNEYFNIPLSTAEFSMEDKGPDGETNISFNRKSLNPYLLGDLMTTITGLVGILIGIAFPTILAIVSNPGGWAVGLVLGLGMTMYAAFKGEEVLEEKFVQKVGPDIYAKLNEQNVQNTFGSLVRTEVRKILEGFSSNLKVHKKQMEDNATIARATPGREVASNCFEAIGIINEIDTQFSKYVEFVDSQLINK